MLKVFMKIPGVSRPLAVVGNQIFEDERFLVIDQDVIRRKIPWESILYIEELPVPAVDGAVAPPETPSPARAMASVSPSPPPVSEKTDLIVTFTGAIEKAYRIDGVAAKIVEGSKWTPDLAQTIFGNPQVKTILGSFIVKECHVDGPNITIVTTASEKKAEALVDVKSKMELIQKFSQAASQYSAPTTGRPSMRLPTDFSMSSSPFERPVPLSPQINEDIEAHYERNGEEESVS